MKQVKFRIWNGMDMVYEITTGKFGTFYVNPEKGDGLNPEDTASLTVNTTKYHEEIPLMQYADINDRGGNEIYEGDVLKYKDEILVIQYSEEMKRLIGFFTKRVSNNWIDIEELGWGCRFIEIVGNIYKNPDLI